MRSASKELQPHTPPAGKRFYAVARLGATAIGARHSIYAHFSFARSAVNDINGRVEVARALRKFLPRYAVFAVYPKRTKWKAGKGWWAETKEVLYQITAEEALAFEVEEYLGRSSR